MDAATVKSSLHARHPGFGGQMPGPWTVVEEFRGIDVLAFSAWSSAQKFARVGYEVKVSRSDMRSELLKPHKRERNVEWCNEFYFAVPAGLLKPDEVAFKEPVWPDDAFTREPCPRLADQLWHRRRAPRCQEEVPVPYVLRPPYENYTRNWGPSWTRIPCRTCGGKGYVGQSLVEREAPTLWVPRDVGLVVVDGRGTHVVKPSPKRQVEPVTNAELGRLVRWVSMRPDRRHHSSGRQLMEVKEA